MKRLTFTLLTLCAIVLMSANSMRSPNPAYGNLYITQIPAVAADVEITFAQTSATTLQVLGSQLGYSQGDGFITILSQAAAEHFGNAGFDPAKAIGIIVGLLDETGDAITNPAPVQGEFMLNPNGPTVVNLSSL